MTTKNERNFGSVKANHGLRIYDYLVVRGKHYKITDIHPDDAFSGTEGSRKMIYVDRNFENNVNNQPLRLFMEGS